MNACSAILLAGGNSSRMGCEKALLPVNGLPLWLFQQRKLEQLASDVIISSRKGLLDVPVVVDCIPHLGPLGGLVSTLPLARQERVVVLGVDLPQMTADFLRRLLAESTSHCGVVPMLDGYFEGLAAVYPRSLLPIVKEVLSGHDHSMQLLHRLAVERGMMRRREVRGEERHLFENWNLPSDLGQEK